MQIICLTSILVAEKTTFSQRNKLQFIWLHNTHPMWICVYEIVTKAHQHLTWQNAPNVQKTIQTNDKHDTNTIWRFALSVLLASALTSHQKMIKLNRFMACLHRSGARKRCIFNRFDIVRTWIEAHLNTSTYSFSIINIVHSPGF